MPNFRKWFTSGRMNKDIENLLMKQDDIRHAENLVILDSDESKVGKIQNCLSNKQMTALDLGPDPKTVGKYEDELNNKIYYLIISDRVFPWAGGCFLIEWDDNNETATFVLRDTRPAGNRALELNENFLITGIGMVLSDDGKSNLLVWTDDNMEICCVNIERAKTWPENGFILDDIALIKRRPKNAPVLTPIRLDDLSNNLEEKFVAISHRYRYRDGEYSALSSFSRYNFTPGKFDLDYYTLDNKGMVNVFNAMKIAFDTGPEQVTDIQLVAKESISNKLYLIETFNKANEGWGNNQSRSYTFSNNKLYTSLPTSQLQRLFDNVPRKAKALVIADNRVALANYLEGYDIVDEDGKKIVVEFGLSLVNEPIDQVQDFTISFPTTAAMAVSNPSSIPLKAGNKIYFNINLLLDGHSPGYSGSFYVILEQDYASLIEFFESDAFSDLLTIMNNDFHVNFNSSGSYDVPDGWVVETEPSINYSLVGSTPRLTVSDVVFRDTADDSLHPVSFSYVTDSDVSISESADSSSVKTNRDYELGIVYEDGFGRMTTVLTSLYNTIFIAQQYSSFKNKIRMTINSIAPAFAKRFKIFVKAPALEYQTIYVNRYYNDGLYVWAKLEAENKDKVKVGDTLIVKKAGNVVMTTPVKIKVLDIKEKTKDFIEDNVDGDGNDIIEEEGLYMRIRPERFSMDFDDYKIYQDEFSDVGSSGYPVGYLDLFTTVTGGTPTDIEIPASSSIYLFLNSSRNFDSGWKNNTYEYTYYAQRDYASIEDWFSENVLGRALYGNIGNANDDYQDNLSIVRGGVTKVAGQFVFSANPSGKLYLKIIGTKQGGSGGRRGYCRAKIVVRTSTGFYVFETETKQAENNIFFETSPTYDIVDGNHMGTVQDQDHAAFVPAVIDVDFFNCYTQGNGVESYRVKDGLNKNYLNIDLRPSATSLQEYKAIRRSADITIGEQYVPSSNLNGLNEFNLSLGNFKELDKRYGSIQAMVAADGDIIVWHEDKVFKILYGKNVNYNPDGSFNMAIAEQLLGPPAPYLGENGIGLHPESLARNNYQFYYVNPRRGVVQRLSIDGTTDIVEGMTDFFRDIINSRPNAKMLGAYDPHHGHYVLSIGEQPVQTFSVQCGNSIVKSNQSDAFEYDFVLNELPGDIVLAYNVTVGNATIVVTFDGGDTVVSNVTGEGTITVPRSAMDQNLVHVSVSPVGGDATYQITNLCPVGFAMKVKSIVLADDDDLGKSITNRYRWGSSAYFSGGDTFGAAPISRFTIEEGLEGIGSMPARGSIVNIQSLKSIGASGVYSTDQCNAIGYLVTSSDYLEADIDDILAAATFISTTQTIDGVTGEINAGNFLFDRTSDDEQLYLIWDYRDKKPTLLSDSAAVEIGGEVTIGVLVNDTVAAGAVVTIATDPANGSVVVNDNGTITYTHDGGESTEDTFTYTVTQNGCSASADVNITITAEAPTLWHHWLGRAGSEAFICPGPTTTKSVYIDVQPYSSEDWFLSVTQIFLDAAGTIPAPAGWYGDNIISEYVDHYPYIHWDGSAVVPGDSGTCTTTFEA